MRSRAKRTWSIALSLLFIGAGAIGGRLLHANRVRQRPLAFDGQLWSTSSPNCIYRVRSRMAESLQQSGELHGLAPRELFEVLGQPDHRVEQPGRSVFHYSLIRTIDWGSLSFDSQDLKVTIDLEIDEVIETRVESL